MSKGKVPGKTNMAEPLEISVEDADAISHLMTYGITS